jgi:hypothetical protein
MTSDPIPPAAPPPAAPAPSRKTPWLKWTALGCGALLVLLAAFGTLMYFVIQRATAGPEQVVQDFLAAAGRGDYAAAHEHFSAPLQEVQPFDQFAAAAAANSMFFEVTETTFNNRSVDTTGAELSGSVTLATGTVVPASFKLVKENGAWKLISYNIGS